MKKIFLSLFAASALAITNAFALPTVLFTDGPGNTGGGEFNAFTSDYGNFITFCMEVTEEHQMNTLYYFNVSEATTQGAPLTLATAWLYTQFGLGTLGTYGAQYAYNHSQAKANDLQWAFWYLQGETVNGNNYYAQLALQQAGVGINNGFYDIRIMNVWDTPEATGPHQDQLVKIPESSSTLILTGLGLVTLGYIRRRRALLN